MKKIYLVWATVFIFSLAFGVRIIPALNDTMVVEANIFGSVSNVTSDIVRVEVPDYLFFGNLTKGNKSAEIQVYVNNTGTIDIVVTPRLVNSSEQIFNNLYFRKFKTSNGAPVNFTKIGDFSFNITKPASGRTFNDEYFYVILDLTNYTGSILNDLIGYKTTLKFFATAA